MRLAFSSSLALLAIASSALVAEAGEPAAASESQDAGLEIRWSATALLQYRWIAPPENDDDVGGWFDQYEFTPNKSSPAPFELGLRDAALDVFGAGGTPVFQGRLESPTSNLGVSGSEIDEPFFNQRLDAFTRLEGLDIDLFYRRMRTEQLRLFPETAGAGLLYDDRTAPTDRFFRDRTGGFGELRLRPDEAFAGARPLESWHPELSLRGGGQARDGLDPLRFQLDPSNDWYGLSEDAAGHVTDVGGGLLVVPGGLFTIAFDFDQQWFRFDSDPITESELGVPPPDGSRTIGFVPSTNRFVGRVALSGELGDRAHLELGFLLSELVQVSRFTPDQIAAGLTDNRVRTYAANVNFDAALAQLGRSGDLELHTVFEFDQRDNHIQRDTPLFSPDNGTQIDPFVQGWRRWLLGVELELRLRGANRAALGLEYEDMGRELEFVDFRPPGSQRILEVTSQMQRDTRTVTLYGRTALRPWRGLALNGELGFRYAPRTGYIVDLENEVYGRLRASYAFSLSRPLVLSGFLEGSTGDNRNFGLVAGQGPFPPGPVFDRRYECSNLSWGLTVHTSPVDPLSLFVSYFVGRHDQDTGLDLSTLQRYFQDVTSLAFSSEGLNRFDDLQRSLILGGRYRFTEQTDARLAYTFTHAKAGYAGSSSSTALQQIADNHVVDSNTHGIDLEVGHELAAGLRVSAGYRLQLYDDRAPVGESIASVVAPFDRSAQQHSVSLAVTFSSDFLAR